MPRLHTHGLENTRLIFTMGGAPSAEVTEVLEAAALGSRPAQKKAVEKLIQWHNEEPQKYAEAVRYGLEAEVSGLVSGETIEMSGFFGNLFKGIKKVAKKVGKGIKKAAKTVFSKKTLNGVLNVAKAVGPAIGIAFPEAAPYIQKGTQVVNALQGAMGPGAKSKSIAQVQRMHDLALQGNQAAQLAGNVLRVSQAAQQGGQLNQLFAAAQAGNQTAIAKIRGLRQAAQRGYQGAQQTYGQVRQAYKAQKALSRGYGPATVARAILQTPQQPVRAVQSLSPSLAALIRR